MNKRVTGRRLFRSYHYDELSIHLYCLKLNMSGQIRCLRLWHTDSICVDRKLSLHKQEQIVYFPVHTLKIQPTQTENMNVLIILQFVKMLK